jgi:T5SS/PEP-CTERM-associated repeat protein
LVLKRRFLGGAAIGRWNSCTDLRDGGDLNSRRSTHEQKYSEAVIFLRVNSLLPGMQQKESVQMGWRERQMILQKNAVGLWVLIGNLLVGNAGANTFYVEKGSTQTITEDLVYTGNAYIGNDDAKNHLIIQSEGSLQNNFGYIGNMPNCTNNTVVVNGPDACWINTAELYVGCYGSWNSLTITNGGSVTNVNGYIGRYYWANNNQVLVDGDDSVWINSGGLVLGNKGKGNTLTLCNGAFVSSRTGIIGVYEDAQDNVVEVRGTNSVWEISYALKTGSSGAENRLLIHDGGRVKNEDAFIGISSCAQGNRVVVSGADSVWENSGDLLVGQYGAYDNGLTVTNGALVSANYVTISTNNNLTLADGQLNLGRYKLKIYGDLILCGASSLTGDLVIGETAVLKATWSPENKYGACFSVSGDATLAGTLELRVDNDLSCTAGDTFKLLDCAGTISGSFSTLKLAAPGLGMSWDTSRLESDGIIKAIYTPAHYVSLDGSDTSPYTNWVTAATHVQDAINAAADGDTVTVAAGTYTLDSEISITNAITLKSSDGAAATILDGNAQTRVLYLANEGILVDGFTITNGYCTEKGGGAYCYDGGTLAHCIISGNKTEIFGGGCYYGTQTNCIITGNTSVQSGGGSFKSTQINCLIADNQALIGGGCYRGTQVNCTIAGNTTESTGGGCYAGVQTNCIVYFNTNEAGGVDNGYDSSMTTCCTTPAASGTGNITNNPCFADAAHGDYSLLCSSPCIDAGTTSDQTTDIDGNARCVDGDFDGTAVPDIGAYEYQPELTDSDGDSFSDYAEYVADTSMTDAEDCFCVDIDGSSIRFTAVIGRNYTLQICTNLVTDSWSDVTTVSGTGTEELLRDPDADQPSAYYRVKVELSE